MSLMDNFGLMDHFGFIWSVFLIVVGLIFAASGFGVFVAGRLDGFVILTFGLAMFWGGWIMSGAKGFPCASAAVLNMIDAASTVAFWNLEANPIVIAIGPALFMIAKIVASLAIMLFAKIYSGSKKEGIALSIAFAFIVGWNVSQHLSVYLGLTTVVYGVLLGTLFTFLASAVVLYFTFISGYIKKETVRPMKNKFLAAGLIALLAFSSYLAWEYHALNNYYRELHDAYDKLSLEYQEKYDEAKYNFTLIMPVGLDEHYEKIRAFEKYRFIGEGDSGLLLFYVTQALHDLGEYSYGYYCIEFNQTYGTSCSRLTRDFINSFIDYVNMSYPDVVRIRQIYNWVNDFVVNINDTGEFERFPIETLVSRCSDDKDQAIALSCLLESCGYETALCLIHDKNLTKYGEDGLRHVFCAVKKGNFQYGGTLIQLYKYSQDGSNWLVLDPAFNHTFGSDPEWMSNYRTNNETVVIPQTALDILLVDPIE